MSTKKLTAFVGTYTKGESEGIYSFTMDAVSGKIEQVKLEAKLENPTYLALSSNKEYLYSVVKEGNLAGAASFKLDKATNSLTAINTEFADLNPSKELAGKQPCYVCTDKNDNYLFSCNYHGGKVEIYPINKDGSLGKIIYAAQHKGIGPNKDRQSSAHVHCTIPTPDNKYLCVVDLGIDKIIVYSFENNSFKIYKEVNFKAGSGPRHMVFHPNERFAYILTELSCEVVTLSYSKENCSFDIIQYISSTGGAFQENNLGAAIHISPDGNYLYVSNRGLNTICCFKINNTDGTLEFASSTKTGGISPRDFEISPSGDFIVAANQDSDNLVTFSVDKATGALERINDEIKLSQPVCIKFV